MDLDLARVIQSIPKRHEPEQLTPLMTPWGERLAADEAATPLPEHPRPQLARERVWVLNGWWEHAFVPCEDAASQWAESRPPQAMDGRIRVPFSPEAPLSGVGRQLRPHELLWYRCAVRAPQLAEGERCLLHFDGVDHACAVYLGGELVGTHEGAYEPFSLDVTERFRSGATTLEVCVHDPSDTGTQLRGKQRLERGGMWYTAQSGIWQSVWLEVVPDTYAASLRIVAEPDAGVVRLAVRLGGVPAQGETLSAEVLDSTGAVVAAEVATVADGAQTATLEIPVEYPRLWSPDDPYLYQLRIALGADRFRSYCAFRTVSVERDAQGVARICLNHQPLFCRGLLDQGYWPDGLMTPPSDAAMVSDLRTVRQMGFNMVRKHIKVESERWYWHADRLGVLVWQDMPSGGANPGNLLSRDLPTLVRHSWNMVRDDSQGWWGRLGAADGAYRRAWTATMASTIERLANHPCVMAWVLFNESWGQFRAGLATQTAWELDPTRPVLSASGWYDQGTGDIHGVHNYFRTMRLYPDPYAGGERGARAQVVSEFGGLTWREDGHSALAHSYGYAEFDTKAEWRAAVRELLAQADALAAQGLSGFVYTQLSDVEEETNGLLTYDRRLCKLV